MTSPFIAVSELADALSSRTPPVVLDASLVLHPAAFDGDYRIDSGYPSWVEGHIPGSLHVDVSTQFSDTTAPLHYTHPAPQAIADELARLGIPRDTSVVIYDSTGTLWGARLWYLLRWIGVNARVLDGGIRAWTEAGHPVESGETPAKRAAVASWPADNRRDFWVSKEELIERTASDGRPLVCGLPATSFSGEAASRYARRGHIPGSVNVSSRDLFASDGGVKSRVEIALAYDAAGVNVRDDSTEVLLYCGGGISAAANALTLAEIGVRAVRIYDGSLEEWSADPSLPLESVTPA
ncbi:rhodanese-like domain-containing protein [Glaciihabitans sp. dw_435]|uniref:sulfurtransferase n=1 Tax=Glaciihabitans sp. dw_435 TaxID=2720081 RepID=UPI001BD65400|nr:rhodanese-like domain-containing protein [Glaciihabitans sp. dw_435]